MKKLLFFTLLSVISLNIFGQRKTESIYKAAGGHISIDKYTVRGEDKSTYTFWAKDQQYKHLNELLSAHFDSDNLKEVIEQFKHISALFKDLDKDESDHVTLGDKQFLMSIMSNMGVKSILLHDTDGAGDPHFWITNKQVENIIKKLEKEIQ